MTFGLRKREREWHIPFLNFGTGMRKQNSISNFREREWQIPFPNFRNGNARGRFYSQFWGKGIENQTHRLDQGDLGPIKTICGTPQYTALYSICKEQESTLQVHRCVCCTSHHLKFTMFVQCTICTECHVVNFSRKIQEKFPNFREVYKSTQMVAKVQKCEWKQSQVFMFY